MKCLADSGYRRSERDDIRPKIFAVSRGMGEGTARLQTIAGERVGNGGTGESDIARGRGQEVCRWPRPDGADEYVVREG